MASHSTLFVDNLPFDVGAIWFKKIFSQFGVVADSFLPFKRSKRTGNRFGFVRFANKVAADIAISRTNGLWLDNKNLITKFARFSIGEGSVNQSRVKVGLNSVGNSQDLNTYPQTQGQKKERKTYAQVTRGLYATKSIHCHAIGNGWLYRSAVAKIRKLLSTKELESVFNFQKVHDVHIRAIGGRYVVITFANEGSRDKILGEKWVMNWFDDIKPWNGEHAKEERFVWISCYGMPLNAWSSQTFKEIGNIWGDFLEVDMNTLKEGSYEKGKILIATDQTERIEGRVELVVDGLRFLVRIEEEESFRKVESSNFLTENANVLGIDSVSQNVDQLSHVQKIPKEALTWDKESKDVSMDSSFNSSHGLESFVEDSLGLHSLFLEAHHSEPVNEVHVREEALYEPLACDPGINIRASQFPGINLLVDIRETEANEQDLSTAIPDSTKIIPEEIESKLDRSEKKRRRRLLSDILNNNVRDCLETGLASSPSESTHSSSDIHNASISTEDISRRNALIVDEMEELVLAGKRYGLHFHENDGGALRKLMQLELEDQRLQTHNLINL